MDPWIAIENGNAIESESESESGDGLQRRTGRSGDSWRNHVGSLIHSTNKRSFSFGVCSLEDSVGCCVLLMIMARK